MMYVDLLLITQITCFVKNQFREWNISAIQIYLYIMLSSR